MPQLFLNISTLLLFFFTVKDGREVGCSTGAFDGIEVTSSARMKKEEEGNNRFRV